jgi:hypothetical protein
VRLPIVNYINLKLVFRIVVPFMGRDFQTLKLTLRYLTSLILKNYNKIEERTGGFQCLKRNVTYADGRKKGKK